MTHRFTEYEKDRLNDLSFFYDLSEKRRKD